MKLTIRLERTFAGKQYENVKPTIEVELDKGAEPAAIEQQLQEMSRVLEAFGADWQSSVLK
jgi:hypothetical protein